MSKRRRNKREKIVLSIPSDLKALKSKEHLFFGFFKAEVPLGQAINNIYYAVKFVEAIGGRLTEKTLIGDSYDYLAGKQFLQAANYRFRISATSNQSFSCSLKTVKILLKKGLLRKNV